MKLVFVFALLVLATLVGPLALDAWDAADGRRQLSEQDREQRRRLDALLTAGGHRDRIRDPYPRLVEALALGKPLSGTLFLVSDLATRSGLTVATLAVQPPLPVAREAGSPAFSEHRVRMAVTGLPRAVNRFIQTLPDVEAPLRIEAARLTAPAARETAARLELDLRVLVSAE